MNNLNGLSQNITEQFNLEGISDPIRRETCATLITNCYRSQIAYVLAYLTTQSFSACFPACAIVEPTLLPSLFGASMLNLPAMANIACFQQPNEVELDLSLYSISTSFSVGYLMPVSLSSFNLISIAPAPNIVLALCQFIIGQNLQPSRNISS
ncbi:MAG: hypothetical protein CMP39_00070 [Rickettsiales bacterium]|nr:hypothetical protein [Rickettsiales bacterium]